MIVCGSIRLHLRKEKTEMSLPLYTRKEKKKVILKKEEKGMTKEIWFRKKGRLENQNK